MGNLGVSLSPLSGGKLRQAMALANKYQVLRIIRPFAKTWINQLGISGQSRCSYKCCRSVLYIAWTLKDPELFKTVTLLLVWRNIGKIDAAELPCSAEIEAL